MGMILKNINTRKDVLPSSHVRNLKANRRKGSFRTSHDIRKIDYTITTKVCK